MPMCKRVVKLLHNTTRWIRQACIQCAATEGIGKVENKEQRFTIKVFKVLVK